ncbi:hypothetical protein Fleli_2583 [Bernardetia litoralis DSM 6794]|uniref:Lipoprotein n=1 Tax=Bernardetia litoralis (strain ATCC 23117 / DSM 6794 / NBRC 15988 / NCIMB 1366 / Fx l1 / Sio-4) TaxID=880071 RepID=I4ALW2_BERLS|nr:hypothetical protein [Bernardetia litoralis]AFM04947.1 hypothetical protein Fleli_2583 [Bernardetia litoralis DSM 6794]
MKRNLFILLCTGILSTLLSCATTTSIFAQTLDSDKPSIELLSEEQIQEWNSKPIKEWNVFFGSEAETWNPFQMKFYEDISVKALSDEEKEKLMNYQKADWEKKFGSAMDTWKVHQLLFYSAILNLTVN